MTNTRRGVWLVLVTLSSLGALGYIASRAGTVTPLPESSRAALEAIRAKPHVYFRSMREGEFGQVVVASLDAPDDERVATRLSCARIDFERDRGLCLVDNHAHTHPLGFASVVDRDLRAIYSLALPGVTSRVRISPGERYAAATLFVTGEKYDADFTTRTTMVDLSAGRDVGDLEQFATRRDGQVIRERDFNFWGVTFLADGNRFFATLATGGKTYLVRGDIGRREMDVLRENAECPSLSPDQGHIVIKSRVPGGRAWRLHVLDASTLEEWPIAGETRSVDDQVEWLDDEHVLYAVLEEHGLPAEAMNVWVSPIRRDATEPARIFIHGAESPAVVRP